MSNMTPSQFDEFYRALYGCEPFPWQGRLARRIAEARPGDACWPETLALPTAAGKTACIDMAIFALSCQADRSPAERTAPRRIFFVVDRRVIVDETFERARKLACALRKARKDPSGILKEVGDRLCSLTKGNYEDDPLACFQLRGGMYRDDAWARSPLQPTVVITTVDQFASRLLFRGYGSSAGMRPIHAGLAANDSLVILDEAHCANPFRQTVDAVKRYRQWAEKSDSISSVPFHLTLLSATPPPEIEDLFTIEDCDSKHQILGRRINASKPARLVVARNARGEQALEGLAQQVANEAKELAGAEPKAIGVIVNRVATARLVHKRLNDDGHDPILLTGRMRSIDRDDIDLSKLKTGAQRELKRPWFIIATQTLEVGADLDFDGLVTECASIDALRQRFGRLNRDGRPIEARATVVVRADQTALRRGDTFGDPIYGTALSETWKWLQERAGKDEIDFGYAAMEAILPDDREELDKLRQRAADAPVMMPAHVDAWVQTSPVPTPDPDVSIFLHGPDRGAPEVQVCWRADLSEAGMSSEEQAVNIVSLCPPVSPECISVPIHVFRRWIERDGDYPDPYDSDVEGTPVRDDDSPRERRQVQRSVLCWRGPAESRLIASRADLRDLRPGDTVVIQEEMGGWEIFGHIPADSDGNQIVDLGDRAHLRSRAKAVLRIHPKLVELWPECPARDRFKKLAAWSEESEDDDIEDEIRQSLKDLGEDLADMEVPSQWEWLKDAAVNLANDGHLKKLPHPGGGFVLQGSHRIPEYMASASTLTSEDDSYSATVRITMEDHLCGVEKWAKRFSEGVGLPDQLAHDLALAARLHDVGKADPRFQAMLLGGHRWSAPVAGELLAKSGNLPTSRRESRRARRESGYPDSFRHELLSVRLIESVPELQESAADWDLVLHLVASHHGHCRPFAPVVTDTGPVKVEAIILGHPMSARSDTRLERLDSGIPERFWRLVRRYGWWGLAWLEALVRVADHRCSEEEEQKHYEDRIRRRGND